MDGAINPSDRTDWVHSSIESRRLDGDEARNKQLTIIEKFTHFIGNMKGRRLTSKLSQVTNSKQVALNRVGARERGSG